jgi:glycosyltransferase involved in cell wall biosynthesis
MPQAARSIRACRRALARVDPPDRRPYPPAVPRVAILTPFALPSVRGNAVTVHRIARGLRRRDVEVRVWDASTTEEATIAAEVSRYRPHLVHAFHAWRVGPIAVGLARRAGIPLVVTLTGTDANQDLFDPDRAATVRGVLEAASCVVAFHPSIGDRVVAALPDVAARLVVVPQAVAFDGVDAAFDLATCWPLPVDRVLFTVAAGIRPVKNVRMPLAPLERLHARDGRVRLAYAGPVLDASEGDALLKALHGRSWARHLGTVPHDQIASLLVQSDVVVNCSLSEGGMANAVLEALALGRAVLASDIPGNRSLVEHGVTGLLYADEHDFERRAEALAGDPDLRARLGRAGRERVLRDYPPSREVDGYLDVYRRLVPVVSA